ncbi:hypothetical protein SISSUDRAFT_1067682 [Sistotremastrum suecicum HHB10207 ss-3]|uniref:BTB domain-containing protein n=1 Tax=Sistotremastrum suecicum HHB10207 ss-3 TaxID=1314776 RepID=A0A165WUI3_9AGAM|nr:hypothetical protein SISSUDRAFT_1067682 [Sistotremastrum suecicum HHB10207 ss-3]
MSQTPNWSPAPLAQRSGSVPSEYAPASHLSPPPVSQYAHEREITPTPHDRLATPQRSFDRTPSKGSSFSEDKLVHSQNFISFHSEGNIHQFPTSVLKACSKTFKQMWVSQGPLITLNEPQEDWDVFLSQQLSLRIPQNTDEWLSVLSIANKYNFVEARQTALNVVNADTSLQGAPRLRIGIDYQIVEWFPAAILGVLSIPLQDLTTQEFNLLGVPLMVKLINIRGQLDVDRQNCLFSKPAVVHHCQHEDECNREWDRFYWSSVIRRHHPDPQYAMTGDSVLGLLLSQDQHVCYGPLLRNADFRREMFIIFMWICQHAQPVSEIETNLSPTVRPDKARLIMSHPAQSPTVNRVVSNKRGRSDSATEAQEASAVESRNPDGTFARQQKRRRRREHSPILQATSTSTHSAAPTVATDAPPSPPPPSVPRSSHDWTFDPRRVRLATAGPVAVQNLA